MVTLAKPIKIADVGTDRLTLRAPTVRDVRAALATAFHNNSRVEEGVHCLFVIRVAEVVFVAGKSLVACSPLSDFEGAGLRRLELSRLRISADKTS